MKKNYNISKTLLIFFLFAIPIYILYFNESENSKSILNLNETLKESYTNYVNLCKNGEIPEFYNINANQLPIDNFNKDGSGCNYYCTDNSLCSFYVTNNNNTFCHLYQGNPSTEVIVNCASKYQNNLPNKLNTITDHRTGEHINYNYNGIGFIKDEYYHNDGSNSFLHNDVILKKANDIKRKIIEIKDLTINSPDNESINVKNREIEDIKSSLAKYLDISMGNLFSALSIELNTFNKDAKTMKFDLNTYNLDEKRDISINPLFNMFKELNKSITNIDGTQEFNELEYNRRYLIYSILFFLTVISIIILLLHKFIPNLISNITLMAYFIGVILIISFIHFLLKQ